MTSEPSIADLCEPDDPLLLAWIAACERCHYERVQQILRETKEDREREREQW